MLVATDLSIPEGIAHLRNTCTGIMKKWIHQIFPLLDFYSKEDFIRWMEEEEVATFWVVDAYDMFRVYKDRKSPEIFDPTSWAVEKKNQILATMLDDIVGNKVMTVPGYEDQEFLKTWYIPHVDIGLMFSGQYFRGIFKTKEKAFAYANLVHHINMTDEDVMIQEENLKRMLKAMDDMFDDLELSIDREDHEY